MTRPGKGSGSFNRRPVPHLVALKVGEHVVVELVERDDFPFVFLETAIVFEFLGAE